MRRRNVNLPRTPEAENRIHDFRGSRFDGIEIEHRQRARPDRRSPQKKRGRSGMTGKVFGVASGGATHSNLAATATRSRPAQVTREEAENSAAKSDSWAGQLVCGSEIATAANSAVTPVPRGAAQRARQSFGISTAETSGSGVSNIVLKNDTRAGMIVSMLRRTSGGRRSGCLR